VDQWTAEEVEAEYLAYQAVVETLASEPPEPPLCDLVILFRAGALRGERLSAFSAHLVDCPSCADMVSLDALVQEAIR
jgi:hypothetical protein